jgi:DNA-binding SARP family transcriptional activator
MEFRLLGPLEARDRGRPLALGGPKQRGVLAMLLLRPNEVVSVDRLVDELWGDRPPRTVTAYIQNCVARLRRVLGAETIETRAPGYVLRTDPKTIDAVRFERALAASAALEPLERATALREALALWRGPALSDFAFEPFAQDEIARLDELRLRALEQQLAAELELGRHSDLIGELEALALRHPTRERLRYLQMLALYRAGRQRDALRVYQETRLELVEELGLEPGEELRSLERLIIAQDPALALAPVEAAAREDGGRRVVALALELVGESDVDRNAAAAALAEIELVVDRHGGSSRQLLAEETIAVFSAHDDDVARALSAATEIRAALPADLTARIAIERDGSDEAARRLLETAAPDDLLLGPSALRLVPSAVDVVPQEAAGGYRVLRFDARSEPFVRHFESPLVGREAELEELEAALEKAVEAGAPRRVVLVGDAGIGKTRLARELAERVSGSARVLTGRCAAFGKGAALLPLVEILQQVGVLEDELEGQPDAERVASRLREPSSYDRSEGFWAGRRLLEAMAASLPVLLVLEDAQWATPALLDFVDYLTGWANAPVMLLVLARPELLDARPEWRDDALSLEPLSDEESRQLASSLAAGVPSQVVKRAEGNPLFLEQLIAAEADTPPPTLEALIESRLDQLPATERAVLERASVVGREFWRAVVEAASPEDQRDAVGAALLALARRRLVHPDRAALPGEEGFRFHHGLIRDVAYAAIGTDDRARLHELSAHSLASAHPELDELIGSHLERAVQLAAEPEPAVQHEAGVRLGTAGMSAFKQFDAGNAIPLLERAIELLPADLHRLELEWALATSHKFAGDWDAALQRLDAVIAGSKSLGSDVIRLRAKVEKLLPLLSAGAITPEDALSLLDDALSVLGGAGDDLGLARAWHLTAVVVGGHFCRCADAGRAAEQALRCYERTGFVRSAVVALLGTVAYRGPLHTDDALERCRALLNDAETPVWQSFVLPFMAVLEAMQGHFEAARDHLDEALVRRREFADESTVRTSWANFAGEVELLAGEAGRAEVILAESCAALRGAGDAAWLATNTASLAEAVYRQGRFDEALELSAFALATAPPGHLTSRSPAMRANALALAAVGRIDEAIEVATRLLDMLADSDVLNERGEASAAAAEVLQGAGRSSEARRRWEDALRMFDEKGNAVASERVRGRLAEVV